MNRVGIFLWVANEIMGKYKHIFNIITSWLFYSQNSQLASILGRFHCLQINSWGFAQNGVDREILSNIDYVLFITQYMRQIKNLCECCRKEICSVNEKKNRYLQHSSNHNCIYTLSVDGIMHANVYFRLLYLHVPRTANIPSEIRLNMVLLANQLLCKHDMNYNYMINCNSICCGNMPKLVPIFQHMILWGQISTHSMP